MKKLSAFIKTYKSLLTRLAVLAFLLIALPLTIYLNSQRQDNRQRAAEGDNLFCSFEMWKPTPDWLKGNNMLSSYIKRFPPDYWDEEKRDWEQPGDPIEKGGKVVTKRLKYDGTPEWEVKQDAILPVRYDPWNDNIRYEFSGRNTAESNWSRFLRRMDDSVYGVHSSAYAAKQISTGVMMKYEIIRIARDGVHCLTNPSCGMTDSQGSGTPPDEEIEKYHRGELTVEASIGYLNKDHSRTRVTGQKITPELLSRMVGFDVTGLDLRLWPFRDSNEQRRQRMITETAACGSAIPTPQPTSTTPVSCDERLMVPPVGYKVDFPSYTPNICAAHIENRNNSATGRTELDVCGEYWITAWCNGNQQNATYACRGWSQTDQNSLLLYYTNRLYAMTTTAGQEGPGGQLAANIAKYGDYRGRRITWNNFMNELKSGKIAFPWEHDNASKSREEVRDNSLQAAAAAIFDKPWGAIREQERLNNCALDWGGTPTPSTPVSITPSISPDPDEDDPITDDGDLNKDIRPKVYKDKSGKVHIAWEASRESTNETLIMYSQGTWNGSRYTFSDPTVMSVNCASQGCAPSIAVNDTTILIAYAGQQDLLLASLPKNGGAPTYFNRKINQMGFGLTPNIAVDIDGNFHIVADGDFKVKYCVFAPTTGNSAACGKYLETDKASSKPEIAIDSQNNIHIVAGKNGVHYLTIPAGATEFTDEVISSGNGQQITADTNGNVYLVWSEDFDIHYCKKTIDSDCTSSNTRVIQEENGTNPSIGVTDSGGIILAYNAGGQRMKYSKYLDGTWSQTTLFGQQGAVGVDVSPISFDSKLSAVWSANWDIWHRNFTFGDGTAFDLTLLLDGIGSAGDYTNRTTSDRSNKDPRHPSRSLAVQFFNEQDQLVYTKIGTVTYNEEGGNFKGIIPLGRDISEGRYYVKIKMDQYLVKALSFFNINIGEVNTHQPITLVTGDTDGNNELNLLDYNIIDGCYKDIRQEARSCDEELGRLSDLNDDGNVNQIDYNLFVRELPAEKGQ